MPRRLGVRCPAVRNAPTRCRGLILGLLLFALQLTNPSCANALDPALDVSQYAHTAWKVRDGFTKGVIHAIAQTPDGYLWLGTEYGLYRFDGVKAVPWQPPPGEQLPASFITSLLVARDGTLWIATLKGLASWMDGKLTTYPELAGQFAFRLLPDREQRIWIGTATPGRLCSVEGGKVHCYGSGTFGNAVQGIYEDRVGNLWVSAETGVWRWKPGPPQNYRLPRAAVWARGLAEDDSGTLLVGTSDGLKQLVGGKFQNYAFADVALQPAADRLLRSSDGSLWVGSQQGLLHLHAGKTDMFGASDGLSGDAVRSIFEDREGSVWVSTSGGLDRFREFAVSSISRIQGLSNDGIYSVQTTKDGAIWIATSDGLNRWQNGRVTVYGKRSEPGRNGTRGEPQIHAGGAVKEIASAGLVGPLLALGLDDQGRLYVSAGEGMFYFDGNQFVRVPNAPGGNIWSIAGDGHGKVWASHGEAGLFHFKPGDVVQPIPWSKLGQKGYGARALLPDLSRDGVWLGFLEGGIAYFQDGEVRASYTAADGLGKGRVNRMRFDSGGTLWAATEGGLSHLRDGRLATLTSKNGLPCDEVHWSIEDDDHFVWLFQPCGLARIARSELDAWVSDPSRKIQFAIFDNSDGVPSVGVYGSSGPQVTQSPDGKIWFVQREGVSVIDPRHLPYNNLPPPVQVERIMADGKTYDADSHEQGGLRLPPLVRNLAIDYTALSLAAPEKVRFRFKLEGQDPDWREVVNSRRVEYSNLAPKKYRFRVLATNNNDVWNEEGAFLDFFIAPAYYQTLWFRSLCVVAFLALLWALYQYRLHQFHQQFNIGLEARVSERLRIARELHDTLLQSFQGLLLRLQTVSNKLPEGKNKQELDSAIDLAAQAITEGRDAVQGLRSSTTLTNELAVAIDALAKELAGNGANEDSPIFAVAIEGQPRDLHPILRDEIYRIAAEAMRNAFRHAQAKRIEVEIHYDMGHLRLRIRDDGKGIQSDVVKGDGRAGHFGLHGMRERAKIIGGNLEVWSSAQSGTEIQLTIPASAAYATARTPRGS